MAIKGDTNNDGVLSPEESAAMVAAMRSVAAGQVAAEQKKNPSIWSRIWGSDYNPLTIPGEIWSQNFGEQADLRSEARKKDKIRQDAEKKAKEAAEKAAKAAEQQMYSDATADALSAMNPQSDITKMQIELLKKLASGQGGGGGGAAAIPKPRMSKEYRALTSNANRMGAATLAEMQRLAGQASQTAAGIGASGEGAASALSKIYGGAAGQVAQASQMAGTYGADLTPVSGALATMPGQISQSGATLSDYLKKNQSINADSAEFLARLTEQQGKSYAEEIARADKLFLMADMAKRERDYQNAVAAARASGGGSSGIQTQLSALELLGKLTTPQIASIDPDVVKDQVTWAKEYDENPVLQANYKTKKAYITAKTVQAQIATNAELGK